MMNEKKWESIMEAPIIRVKPPGPLSSKMLEEQDRFETASRSYTKIFRTALDYGKNATVVDVDGNVFIDLFAGVSVINMGHGNPDVINAIQKQTEKLTHITEVPTESRISFLKILDSTLPGKMGGKSKIFTTVTGGDACELAIQLARFVTGKKVIVAFGGSYHGIAGNIVSATANSHYREYSGNDYLNTYHLPYPYPYRFPQDVEPEEMSKIVAENLENLITDPYSGTGGIAGVIVEPVQGEGGYIVPPKNFLPLLREITQKHNVPLIVDEVQTGMGRTGKIWATEYSGITPDIMTISKSVGGGIPISMIAYDEEYDRNLPAGFHLGTYRANPLGLAAGNIILQKLKHEEFMKEIRNKGNLIIESLRKLETESRFIGDVRGLGLMVGVEFVKDRKTKEPNGDLAQRIKTEMFNRGVLIHTCGHYANVIRFMPPLTIEEPLLRKVMNIFSEVVVKLSKD
ncbi:MAG: aspartate aminotransferase family protein [Thermoplasmataceae archaeon]